jgi:hypothetical protein
MADIVFEPNPKAVRQLLENHGMARMIEKVAEEGASAAADLAPRRSGDLAASVRGEVVKDGDEWVGLVSFGEWYGKFWEWGFRGRSKPFLRPGVQQALSRYGGRFRSQ